MDFSERFGTRIHEDNFDATCAEGIDSTSDGFWRSGDTVRGRPRS